MLEGDDEPFSLLNTWLMGYPLGRIDFCAVLVRSWFWQPTVSKPTLIVFRTIQRKCGTNNFHFLLKQLLYMVRFVKFICAKMRFYTNAVDTKHFRRRLWFTKQLDELQIRRLSWLNECDFFVMFVTEMRLLFLLRDFGVECDWLAISACFLISLHQNESSSLTFWHFN